MSINDSLLLIVYINCKNHIFYLLIMKEGFFSNIKSMFNNKKPVEPKKEETMIPRVVNFGPSNEEKRIVRMNPDNTESDYNIEGCEEMADVRYEGLEKMDLKSIGLKKYEIVEGEVGIMYETKFVFSKMHGEKYEQVSLLQTNYKIGIKHPKHPYTFFPLGKIQKLHKYSNNENAFKILILLKDGRKFKFRIAAESVWKKIYDKIECFTFIRSKKQFFAFRHFDADQSLQQKYKGWSLYNPQRQFQRMGIKLMPHTEQPVSEYWSDFKILDNRDGRICTTYPAILVVPSRMPYDYLVRCSKFRSRSRMPALSYVYQFEKGKFSTIYRSSQSKVGVQNSRCAQDQIMLRIIGDHSFNYKDDTPHTGPPNCMIYDARNYIAALGNKFSGKGFQYSQFYRNCQLDFLNIPNIHAVRQAYVKMVKASYGQDTKFHAALAESLWYDYVFLILAGAVELSKNLRKGYNNLVHCSDGWDRTAQLCCLAEIIVDPYYRTMQGFQILIQKDWIHFGHQFATRMAQGVNNPNGQEKSQIFLQFLDCVSQMLYQYPSEFQFNYSYLQEIGEQAYNHLYGNFLCNCELEMEKVGIARRTVSLWSHLAEKKNGYKNPFYFPSGRILEISSAQKHMRFWKEHFLQHVEGFRDVYDIFSCKFTQDNLDIMHQQLLKEDHVLSQRHQENKIKIKDLNYQISIRSQDTESKNPQILNQHNNQEDTIRQTGQKVQMQQKIVEDLQNINNDCLIEIKIQDLEEQITK